MKTFKQVVLPIIVVMVLVFGVTFLSNYTAKDRSEVGPTDSGLLPQTTVKPLEFGIEQARRDPEFPFLADFRSEYEFDEHGAFDFWFQNPNAKPVTLRVTGLSCQCQNLEAGVLTPEGTDQFYRQSSLPVMPALFAMPSPVAIAGLANLAFSNDAKAITRKPMTIESDSIGVPAADAQRGPQLGFVRLNWKGKNPPGPKVLNASMTMQLDGEAGKPFKLEALTIVLPIIRIWPAEIDFGELANGGSETREFYIISSTRTPEELSFVMETQPPHPCFEVGKAEVLPPEELKVQERRLSTLWQEPLTLRAGWIVRVTAHENRGKNQLDLGPINRNLYIKAGEGEGREFGYPMRGMVRGDVRLVGSGESRDRIDFGTALSTARGKTHKAQLISDRPATQLEVVASESVPSFLGVELIDEGVQDGQKQWTLVVTVPPGKLAGSLPPTAGVMLQTKDTPPRRVRIPVRGGTIDSTGEKF